MAIYTYANSPLIDRIEVKSPRAGIAHASILASAMGGADGLSQLRQGLAEQGFSTLTDSINGRATLQVRGIKDENQLLEALEKIGVPQAGAQRIATPDDTRPKQEFMDMVRDNSVFLSALFYDLGNIAFFVSGFQRGRHNKGGRMTSNDKSEMMIGAAFSVGDLLMTAYGHDRGDEELKVAADGLQEHLKRRGVAIPQGSALTPETLNNSGAMKVVNEWMHKHIIQIKCLSEFAGGLFTMHAAVKPGNRNNGKLAAGFLLSTAWMSTFLLDKPPGHQILDGHKEKPSTIAEAVTDNPRGCIARPLAIANNIANLWGSLNPYTGEQARFAREVTDAQSAVQSNRNAETLSHLAYTQTKRHDYIWNVISACSFLVAHSLFGLSGSKRPAENDQDKTMMNDLVLLSANVLAKQPDTIRDIAIDDTAEYVSRLAHVKLTRAQLKQAITEKVYAIQHSSWSNRLAAPATSEPQQAFI